MKNAIVWIVVAVGLVTGTPAAVGWFLARGADTRLDEELEAASFMNLTEHTYHRGWFTSDETITVELLKGVPMPPVGAADAQRRPIRITVHNTIHHGPLPALAGLGLARVDTEFVPPAGTSTGDAPPRPPTPVTIQTTLGFFGDSTTEIRQPAIKDTALTEDWHLAADSIDFTIHRGRHTDSIDVTGKAPHVLLTRGDGTRVELTGLQAAVHSKRALRSIYLGNSEFTVGDFEVTMPAGAANRPQPSDAPSRDDPGAAGAGAGDFSIRAARFIFNSDANGDFVNSNGVVTVSYMGAGANHAQGVKLDVAVEHLQMDAFDRISTGMRKIQRAHPDKPIEQVAEMRDLWKSDGVNLLVNDPGLVIRDFELATKDGFVKVTGTAHLKGATPADFKPALDVRALLSKLDVDLKMASDERFAEKMLSASSGGDAKKPSGPTLQSLEAQGYVTRGEGRITTTLRFVNGGLTVNGKPFAPTPPAGGAPH